MDTQTSALHEVRLDHVVSLLARSTARSVIDLGCGSGALLQRCLESGAFDRLVGLESSGVSLRNARERLAHWLEQPEPRVQLVRGSFQEPNAACSGFDAAAMVEVIEHVPPRDLSTVERAVFEYFRPSFLVMTTPNRDYNPLFGLAPGELRDPDHRFEWSQARFRQWASGVAKRNGYRVRFGGIGEADPELGSPSQLACFERID
ncbi:MULTISPECIES: methyltransferase [Halomonadaceae]|uniref:Small RNA 2'-O-methyltransferase n=1 Tax=Vreelandella halophila TaxID=86177 RepID=A0A9X4YD93_9GAMM|nr:MULTISPECIES: methyltransferase [Halomonas]MYL27712.1 methyltransferase domain-containing protein [Halomonas utahensis]MYL75442.1 methyltransferase domain-containing protein [Halomonas sp. 22501_18_FS]